MFIQILSGIRWTTDSFFILSPDSSGDANSVISGCDFQYVLQHSGTSGISVTISMICKGFNQIQFSGDAECRQGVCLAVRMRPCHGLVKNRRNLVYNWWRSAPILQDSGLIISS